MTDARQAAAQGRFDKMLEAIQAQTAHMARFVQLLELVGNRLDAIEDRLIHNQIAVGRTLEACAIQEVSDMAAAWSDYHRQRREAQQSAPSPLSEPAMRITGDAGSALAVPEDEAPAHEPQQLVACDVCKHLVSDNVRENCEGWRAEGPGGDWLACGLHPRIKPDTQGVMICDVCKSLDAHIIACRECGIQRREDEPMESAAPSETVDLAAVNVASLPEKASKTEPMPAAFQGDALVKELAGQIIGAWPMDRARLEDWLDGFFAKAWREGWRNAREDGAPLREVSAPGAVDRAMNALSPYLRTDAQFLNNGDHWKARNVLCHLLAGDFGPDTAPEADWLPMVDQALARLKALAAVSNGLIHIQQPSLALAVRAIVLEAFNAGDRNARRGSGAVPAEDMHRQRQQAFAEGEAEGARRRGEEAMADLAHREKQWQAEREAAEHAAWSRAWLAASAHIRQIGVQMSAHVPDMHATLGADEQE